jgi:hypothetical protein
MYRQCETRRMRELLTRHAEAYNRLATRAAAMAVAVFAVTFAVVGTGAGARVGPSLVLFCPLAAQDV